MKKMWWKRLGLAVLMVLFVFSLPSQAETVNWSKYVTADGGFSFHYPEGWLVTETETGFVVHDADNYEQLWLVLLNYEESWTAEDHARFFLSLIQEETPEMDAYGWELDYADEIVLFDLIFDTGRGRADGLGLVIKDIEYEQVLWFHYLAGQGVYTSSRAETILEGFVNSIAGGADSQPPVDSYQARLDRIERNLDGFLFVIEFALGSPLPLATETLLASEFRGLLMEYTEEELAPYDEYPHFAEFIRSLSDPAELLEVQEGVAASIWEWIDESDPNDPIVRRISDALRNTDRVLIQGTIPLTEGAATSYAEFVAFAEYIDRHGTANASPSMIDDDVVLEIKGQLIDAWRGFSTKEQEQVAALPAVWTVLRRAVNYGDSAEREMALKTISQAIPSQSSTQSSGTESEEYDPADWVRHYSTMQIQQQTFNHYMWSVGYHNTIYGF
ncbi:MAG TPA: hypothetical protein GXZ85_11190 [Firmicutes bacterium]|nr:hypothetical protein [Bacillota bacterium]